MTDSSVPDLEPYYGISQAFLANLKRRPQSVFFEQAIEAGGVRRWESFERSNVAVKVLSLAGYLKSQGVTAGDRVAIISSSRPEWVEADLAIMCLGGVVVSIYPSLSAQEVGYILYDSESKIVFLENREQYHKLVELGNSECKIPATEDRAECQIKLKIPKLICFDAILDVPELTTFEQALQSGDALHESQVHTQAPHDLASLVYTSGTTGPPKGVMQTHANHLANVRQAVSSGLVHEGMSLMVFLPLAHSFAKLMAYIGCVRDVTLKFPAIVDRESSKMNAESVTRDIREGSAEIVPIVPRILEKMQEGIEHTALRKDLKGRLVKLTLSSAQGVYSGRAGALARVGYALTGFVRRSIRRTLFGPNFRYAVSGGAKLNPETCKFFDALQIEILEGYGLTETCVATNANRLGRKKVGTVGPLLSDDILLKIAEDSEILFKGPNITRAYYKRELATKAAWDAEGWFHTGDMGELDQDGFLKIIGRKKELLVTSYGKKIAPEEVENKIKRSNFISQAVLLGDNQAYCTALITLNQAALHEWARNQVVDLYPQVENTPQVVDLLNQEIGKINEELASFEQVKKFKVLPVEFSIDNGLLTPTFKVKRREVSKRFAAEIAGLYAKGPKSG